MLSQTAGIAGISTYPFASKRQLIFPLWDEDFKRERPNYNEFNANSYNNNINNSNYEYLPKYIKNHRNNYMQDSFMSKCKDEIIKSNENFLINIKFFNMANNIHYLIKDLFGLLNLCLMKYTVLFQLMEPSILYF